MADVQHPENHPESLSSHDGGEKRDLTCPRCRPVVLVVREIDQSHIEDDSQKTLHFR